MIGAPACQGRTRVGPSGLRLDRAAVSTPDPDVDVLLARAGEQFAEALVAPHPGLFHAAERRADEMRPNGVDPHIADVHLCSDAVGAIYAIGID